MYTFTNLLYKSGENKMVKLTNCEKEVMQVLWDSETPMTANELIKISKDRSWKDSYIYILLNSLIRKGMINCVEFRKTTKNYARAFSASISRDEYYMQLIREKTDSKKILESIIQNADQKLLDSLADILESCK